MQYDSSLPSPAPQAFLRRLIRVVPIAKTIQGNGIEIFLLALESYTDGFTLTIRMLRTSEPSEAGRHPVLQFPLRIADDRGHGYVEGPYRDASSGGGPVWEFRGVFSFVPALDPAANSLAVEISTLNWSHVDVEEQRVVTGESQSGPWRVTVPLAPFGVG